MNGDQMRTKCQGHHKGNTTEFILNRRLILKKLNLVPGQKIIDAGYGNGYISKEFSKLVQPSGKVFALDCAKEAIEKLQKETKGTHIDPIEADIAKTTPIDHKSIDLIYVSCDFWR
jgi:precorrin-6B methylase 2